MASNNLGTNILKSLKKTGYPLEIKISKILMDRVISFRNQQPYIDPETKKIRTIDLIVDFEKSEKKTKNSIKRSLAIECKKSENPWVFFGFKNRGYKLLSTIHKDAYLLESSFSKNKTSRFSGNHYIIDYIPCISGIQVFTNGTRRNSKDEEYGITNAANQVTKGAFDLFLAYKKNNERRFKENKIESEIIVYPVIIFEGNLYVTESPEQESDIVKVDWLTYKFPLSFESELVNREFIIIDIVNEKYFSKYLDSIEEEFYNTHLDTVGYQRAVDSKEEFYDYIEGVDYKIIEKLFHLN